MRQMDTMLINTFYSGAMANITAMLYLGRKVMLNHRNNSTHAIFKNYGLDLPTINTDDVDNNQWLEEIFEPLDEKARLKNRNCMLATVSEQSLVELYCHLLKKTA
jgi:hypothetical protein